MGRINQPTEAQARATIMTMARALSDPDVVSLPMHEKAAMLVSTMGDRTPDTKLEMMAVSMIVALKMIDELCNTKGEPDGP